MAKRKLLSGEWITRSEKKFLRNMEGDCFRGRRKFIRGGKQTQSPATQTAATDLLIRYFERELQRVWDEITRSPNPPVFNNWGYVVTVDIKTSKENG